MLKAIDTGRDAAIEAEMRAARERAIIPLEIRMHQFHEMLAEKEVCTVLYLSISEKSPLWKMFSSHSPVHYRI